RETDEEVGANGADILGQFESLYVPPSDFEIHPVIGYTPLRPEWKPHAAEVAAILEAPLSVLLDDSLKGHEPFVRGEITFEKHYYLICGQQVWGATAILLSELERRLRAVLAE
ncbi:MAG TPA: hypothetical protein PLD47_11715, partial [Aggregatilineales bacterium]|nr:hypothetical protein [Aggregatilineales bacterium]